MVCPLIVFIWVDSLCTERNETRVSGDGDDDDNTGLLSVQVKKAVGGPARGMALYEDDVSPDLILMCIGHCLTFLLHSKMSV